MAASFQVAAGERLEVSFTCASIDGKGNDDCAWTREVDAGTGSRPMALGGQGVLSLLAQGVCATRR